MALWIIILNASLVMMVRGTDTLKTIYKGGLLFLEK